MVKIFLDDIRQPHECAKYMHTRIGKDNPIYLEDWTIARNFEEFREVVDEHYPHISHISFDHDLAPEHYVPEEFWDNSEAYQAGRDYKEPTGYECAKWLLEYYEKENDRDLPIMYVHSMNPVGTQNIINLFK